MFTEEQLNQLHGLLAPVLQSLARLDASVEELKSAVVQARAELRAHAQTSEKEHAEMTKVVVDTMDAIHDSADARLKRLEENAGLPPLE